MRLIDRVNCAMGKHRLPVSLVGMTEQSDTRGVRTRAGARCRCGALVFMQMSDWRKGVGAKRALKREAVKKK